jgi:hypothetical protein
MVYCDLSDTNVDDEMMASFLPAADKMTTLLVSGCNGLTNGFMRQVQGLTLYPCVPSARRWSLWCHSPTLVLLLHPPRTGYAALQCDSYGA